MKKKLKTKFQEIGLTFGLLSPAYQNLFTWWFEPKYAGKEPKAFTEQELDEILTKATALLNECKSRKK